MLLMKARRSLVSVDRTVRIRWEVIALPFRCRIM